MHHHIVETRASLEALYAKMETVQTIAVDTEFLRVKTYYPRFCLLQIASGAEVYCVDPLAMEPGDEELREIICAPERTTVFHAARQDIEVLYGYFKDVPQKVFDTQVAAAMVGLGDQIGYAGLVETLTGRVLPKAHTRTDWCQRPLSRAQIAYAVDDVRYLETIFELLASELDKRGRLDWVFEECRALSDVGLYRADADSAYRRIGHGDRLAPAAQRVLKELAIWREKISQHLDLPRNWVVKDRLLADIARSLPDSREKLAGIEGVSDKFVKRYGEQVIDLVREVLRLDDHVEIWRRKTPLNAEQRALQKQIQECLERVAKEAGISQGLLATRQDVARLARGRRDVGLLRGWRAQLLDGQLEPLLG